MEVTHGKTENIYLVYEINLWDRVYDDYPTQENFLFGAVKLVKNADIVSTNILDMVLDLTDVERFQQNSFWGRYESVRSSRYTRSSPYSRIRWYYIDCRNKKTQLILLNLERNFV